MNKQTKILIGIIVLLAFVLTYVLLIGPQFEKYMQEKQIQAQVDAVNTIIQIVNQQGYVVFGEGEEQIVLIKYEGEVG